MTAFSGTFRFWEGVQNDPAIANNWGTPNSFNMTLVEAPLGGTGGIAVVSLAGLTSFSLSTANGATDQARPFLQQYTGALPAACTVTIPNLPRAMGWAQNLTTGGFNVILSAGAGTTVSIPPDGRWYWYQTDGATNVTRPSVAFGTAIPGPVVGTSGNFSGGIGAASIVLSNNVTASVGEIGTLTALNSGSGILVVEGGIASNTPAIIAHNSTNAPNAVSMIVKNDRSDGTAIAFQFGGAIVGTIKQNSATTSYNTTSDAALKINRGPVFGWDATHTLNRLVVRWFNWKSDPDGPPEPGFFAQQVFKWWPWAVTRGSGRGKNRRPWQMDNAKLMPLVVAALQHANERITALEKGR